jgi:hypothetical protein
VGEGTKNLESIKMYPLFTCFSDAPGVGDELGGHDGGGGQGGRLQVIINVVFALNVVVVTIARRGLQLGG